MKMAAIVQARMLSERLPGKILKPLPWLDGPTVLEHLRNRIRPIIPDIIIATTTDPSDDATEAEAARLGLPCYRGSHHDVLDRFVQAARLHEVETVVRLTADNACYDATLFTWALAEFHRLKPDYWATRGLPLGLNIEICTRQALEKAHAQGRLPSYREHVTAMMYLEPGLFHTVLHEVPPAWQRPEVRVTLDTPEDYTLLGALFDMLFPSNPNFGMQEIFACYDAHPWLAAINSHVEQKKP